MGRIFSILLIMFSHGRGGVCRYEACPFMKMGEGYKHQAYLIM